MWHPLRGFILQNLILRTRSCDSGCITQPGWVHYFRPTKKVGRKFFVPLRYQLRSGMSGGPALNCFGVNHRVGRARRCAFCKFRDNLEISFMDSWYEWISTGLQISDWSGRNLAIRPEWKKSSKKVRKNVSMKLSIENLGNREMAARWVLKVWASRAWRR